MHENFGLKAVQDPEKSALDLALPEQESEDVELTKKSYEKIDFEKFAEVGDYFWSALIDEEGFEREFLCPVPAEHYLHPEFDSLLNEEEKSAFLKLAISAIQEQKIGTSGAKIFSNYEFADRQLQAYDDFGYEPGVEIDVLMDLLHKFEQLEIKPEEVDDSLNFLVNFWKENGVSIILPKISELLNKIDSTGAAGKLLKLLNTSEGDKNHLAALLYRLEFGQIGISESGVKYLEKMYDLEDLNRPDYFAQRLTASGEIGIFDENRVLQKYFELGDLASSDKNVKPKVHDFVYETLFRPRANETEQERLEREQYLKEFKENYFQFYDDKFFAQTAVRFNNLEFEEQGWFLMYYRKVDEETKTKLIDFVKKNGEAGLKSFLSLEYNDQNGEAILFLEGKLESQDFKKLFAKYLQIQNKAQVLAESISDSQFKDSFYDAIMSRASDILSTACQLAENKSAEAEFYQGQKLRVEKIEEVLESLEIFADFLEKLKALFLQEGAYDFSHLETSNLEGLDIYQFEVLDKATKKKSFANLSLRPQGTNEHLAEKEFDGEARINFLFSDQPIAVDIKEKSRLEALSFRLDRECLNFDDEGKVVDRDNTRAQGRAALDFGSAFTDSGEQNNVLARVISVGNFYNAQAKSKKPEYYHNKESFYQTLGEAEIFAEVVEQIKDFIERKYVNKG
jgi:hypothetical protein